MCVCVWCTSYLQPTHSQLQMDNTLPHTFIPFFPTFMCLVLPGISIHSLFSHLRLLTWSHVQSTFLPRSRRLQWSAVSLYLQGPSTDFSQLLTSSLNLFQIQAVHRNPRLPTAKSRDTLMFFTQMDATAVCCNSCCCLNVMISHCIFLDCP